MCKEKVTTKRIALFAGMFDPFTAGHQDILERALCIFDEVVVAVVNNYSKKSLLTPQERVRFIQSANAGNDRVRVICSDQPTVDVAAQVGATCIVRGVRSVQDYEYERNYADIYRAMGPVDVVLLCSRPELGFISSSLVRELISFGRDITGYVPSGADLSIIKK